MSDCYVRKGAEVLRVPLNEWGNYLANDYTLTTQRDYETREQPEPAATTDSPRYGISMASSKAQILAFATEREINVDTSDNKADLLWGIAQVLGVDPGEFGVEADEA